MLIDTHSHVYLSEFEADREEVITRAAISDVKKILLPNIDVSTISPLNSLVQSNPTLFYGMMGLHPGSVNANYKEELFSIKKELFDGNYLAVGEIGIDLYWDKTFLAQQIKVFRTQIEWALALNLPIVIHVRESFKEVFEVLDEYKDSDLRGVFHCFSGGLKELEKALSYTHFYLGIGGVLTFKNAGLDAVIKEAPLNRLVLETDAPYLAPVPNRGKRNEPSYIALIADKLAQVKEVSLKEIETITSNNAMHLFNLDAK